MNKPTWYVCAIVLLSCCAFDLMCMSQAGGPPQPNPNCPHWIAVQKAPQTTSCMPPPECICQQACAVLCKP
jgi:hypothetical protein